MDPNISCVRLALSKVFTLAFALSLSLPAILSLPIPSAFAATFTVTNLNDAGAGSLRQAITDANGNPGADVIQLAADTRGTINLASDLPVVTESVTIDATTGLAGSGAELILNAAGMTYGLRFSGATNVSLVKDVSVLSAGICFDIITEADVTLGGTGANDGVFANSCGTAGIEFNGATGAVYNSRIGTEGASQNGIRLNGTWNSVIIGGSTANHRNIISGNTQNGILITGSGSNATIQGNYIGTDVNGTADLGNGFNGIQVDTGVSDITIGGNGAGQGNVISGNNLNGVYIESNGVTLKGNYIGLSANGTADLGNSQKGVSIASANNVVGGSNVGDRNYISGNDQSGIYIDATSRAANNNLIQNNYIGTNAAGDGAIGNTQYGISLRNGAVDNIIGGTNTGNLISGNGQQGIVIETNNTTGTIVKGNTIGLAADQTTALGNTGSGIEIQGDGTLVGQINDNGDRNIISSNGDHGIWINGADSVTIVNNFIGLAVDGTTARPNTINGIQIEGGSTSNIIGGTSTNAGNKLNAGANVCVVLDATAGNFNRIERNNCVGAVMITRGGASNEGIATPTVDASGTTSILSGTAPANATIEVYLNGVYSNTTTAAANGLWSLAMASLASDSVVVTATNISGSTSASSTPVNPVQDSTAPSTLTVTSHSSTSYTSAATTDISGTKEANTNVLFNDVQQVAIDANTTWTVSAYALNEGPNGITVVSKDYSQNPSASVALTIIRDSVTPSVPTLTYSSTGVNNIPIVGTGTEAGADVYVDGQYRTAVDGLGNFTVYVDPVGTVTYSITIRDKALNTSAATTATITGTGGGGGGGGGSGGSSSSSSSNTNSNNQGKSVIEQNQNDQNQEENSMAGDEEIVIAPEETPSQQENGASGDGLTPGTPNPDSKTTNNQGKNVINPNGGKTTEPKSFYSGIYEYIKPIKAFDPREGLPAKPAKSGKFDQILKGNFLGEVQANGLPDKLIEIKFKGVDPGPTRDTDGDGLYDYEEILYGGDPEIADTDGDGVKDLDEVYRLGTDPEHYDTDRDGIADQVDTEPLIYNAPFVDATTVTSYMAEAELTVPVGTVDSDGDGLSDLHELYLGTDPLDADTDSDGLKDGEEILHYGTDPAVTTNSETITGSSMGRVRAANVVDEEVVEAGEQFIMGHAAPKTTIQLFEVTPEGEMILLGETESDVDGRFVILSYPIEGEGGHTLVLTSGGKDFDDISGTFTVNVIRSVNRPEFVQLGGNDLGITQDKRPQLSLKAGQSSMIVVAWRSTIYSQTLIADASAQIIEVQPAENLEEGEHTVTWYAVDLETNQKSAPTRVSFTVTNTAFVTGENLSSPLTIIFGSIAVLASLTALALFLRKRRIKA